jgi:hypothetical protein
MLASAASMRSGAFGRAYLRSMYQELGVDFEPVTVNLVAGKHRRPEFLKINTSVLQAIQLQCNGRTYFRENHARWISRLPGGRGRTPGLRHTTNGAHIIRTNKYLNNMIVQDPRRVKQRVKPMLEFKRFDHANTAIGGERSIPLQPQL